MAKLEERKRATVARYAAQRAADRAAEQGMQYIDISQLWGPSAGCHFRNGVYIGIERQAASRAYASAILTGSQRIGFCWNRLILEARAGAAAE